MATSFGKGALTSLIGNGMGELVEHFGGKVMVNKLGKLSKRQIKCKVSRLYKVKGSEGNAIKDINYLMQNATYKDLGKNCLERTYQL